MAAKTGGIYSPEVSSSFLVSLGLVATFLLTSGFLKGSYDFEVVKLVGFLFFVSVPFGLMFSHSFGFIKSEQPFWEILTISFGLGVSVIVSVPYLMHASPVFALIVFGSALFFLLQFFIRRSSIKRLFVIRLSQEDWLMVIIFFVLYFAYLYPIGGLFVPPLHDPSANVIMAHRLVRGFFDVGSLPLHMSGYPPGASLFAAVGSWITGVNTAKSVLFFTNFFNFLTSFSFALLCKRLFDFSWMGVTAVLVCSMHLPSISSLYFRAGKNSQIMGYFLLFLALFSVVESLNSRKAELKVAAVLLMIAAIVVHYNNLVVLGLSTPFFLLAGWGQFRRFDRWEWFGAFVSILIFTGFMVAFSVSLAGTRSGGHVLAGQSSTVSISVDSVLLSLKLFFAAVLQSWDLVPFVAPTYFYSSMARLGSILVPVIAMVYIIRRRFFPWVFLLGLPFIVYSPLFFPNRQVRHFASMNFFLPQLFYAAVVVGLLNHWVFSRRILRLPIVVCFCSLSIISLYLNVFVPFEAARRLSPVRAADIRAFDWIRANTPPDARFLPVNVLFTHGVAFETDASNYLKFFAGREEILGFTAGDYFEDQNANDIALFREFAKSPGHPGVVKAFLDRGIEWVFKGSYAPWGESEIPVQEYPETYRLVYESDGAKVFRIIR